MGTQRARPGWSVCSHRRQRLAAPFYAKTVQSMAFKKGKKIKGRDLKPGMTFRTKLGAEGKILRIEPDPDGSLFIVFDGVFMRKDGGFSRGMSGFGPDEDFWLI